MTWVIILFPIVLTIYVLTVLPRTGLFTADSIFVYVQLLMVAGTLPLLKVEYYVADQVHLNVLIYTFVAYVSTSILINGLMPSAGRKESQASIPYAPGARYVLLMLFSVAIIAAYFQAIGYSAFIEGVRGVITGTKVDVATLRLESYAGSTYLYPGYVNQFRNALLPGLTLVAATYWMRKGGRRPFATIFFVAASIFGLLGTAQRGSFVIFMLMAVTYMYLNVGRRISVGRVGALALVAIPMFVISSAALARDSPLIDRFVRSNQTASVVGFRYIYELPIANGSEWVKSLTGLIPGSAFTGSTLSSDIFRVLYGGSRGTSPPSLWGSVYHNFGIFGIVLAPIVFAVILNWVTRKAFNVERRTSLEWMGIAGVFVCLGTWVAGGPIYLPNSGLVVFGLMWWVGARQRLRGDTQGDEASNYPQKVAESK